MYFCSGFVSGSAAKEVKFWEWAIVEQQASQARQLTVNNTRTLEMTDDVMCVRISPNGACALQLVGFCMPLLSAMLRGLLHRILLLCKPVPWLLHNTLCIRSSTPDTL